MTVVLVRAFRFAPIVLLVAFTILFSTSFGRVPSKSFAELPNEVEMEPHPFDEAIQAQEFDNLKRAPVGQQAIPVERYLTANDQVKAIRQYSTATNTFTDSQLSTWIQLGPGNIGGRTRALVIDPDPANPSTMYAAGVAGGIWKTTNGAASWTPIGDLLPNLAVTSLVLDPTSPVSARILYAGTGEIFAGDGVRGAGIFKSTNSGNSWVPLNTSDMANFSNFYYVNDIVISPNTSQTIFAATYAGIWRSVNSGATWKSMLSVSGGCQDLAIRTDRNPDYILASCGSVIYRSTTGGGKDTWVPVYSESDMGRTSLAIAPSNQNFVYALASSASFRDLLAVLKSTDGGGSWVSTVRGPFSPSNLNTTLLSNPLFPVCYPAPALHQGSYDNVIAVDPSPADPANPNRVWAGGIDLFRSDDGGYNWGIASYWWAPTSNAHYAHADQHVIVFHPQYNGGTNKTMFVGNDGGIFRTDNALASTGTGSGVQCDYNHPGASWVSLNNNYGVTQFYHGLPYPNGATYIGGTQDNGTVRGSDSSGINGWGTSLSGDGGYVAVDRANPSIVYAENFRKSLKKSFDEGASFPVSATNGITDPDADFPFVTPFIMDPSNPQRLWIGGRSMWRTSDAANNWTQASTPIEVPCTNPPCTNPPPATRGISAIAVAPTNPNRVLAGTFDGHIYRTDAGLSSSSATTWNNLQLRGGVVSWISFDPADINNNIVYATFSNFNSAEPTDRHIYKSTDGGVSWAGVNGWTLDIPVHCIVVDPNNSSKLYVGTDLGVFVSLDGGATWNRENTGFANAVTESLAFDTTGGTTTLFAFTHGRGAWRVPVSTSGGCTDPVASPPSSFPTDTVYVDDQLPAGAVPQGTWVWDTVQKASGLQSNTEPAAAGIHQHYFNAATQTLSINAGDKLVCYVLLSTCSPPQEVMLQWSDTITGFSHRAFWGADLIPWGTTGTADRYPMGALPATGQWVRLEVSASLVGLEGQTVNGMAFTLYNGQSWFDRAGKSTANVALAANGGVVSASSTYSAAYPTSAANNGDRKGLNWGNGGGWNDATANSYPDWIQVDFSGSKTITKIDVFTLQDNFSSPAEPTLTMTFAQYGIIDFNVQYWNGSAWVTVTGGAVTGNNKVWRQFSFSASTTTKIRVLINNALASHSRVTEIEAY